jgi:hypothetical protein
MTQIAAWLTDYDIDQVTILSHLGQDMQIPDGTPTD